MKAKLIKNMLADAVVCDESSEIVWENFNISDKELTAKEIFFDFNKEEFQKDIDDFFPVLTPFEDYDLSIKKFHDRKEYLEIETCRIIPYETYSGISNTERYINGKRIELIETEYVRLILLYVFPEQHDISGRSCNVMKLASLPAKFMPGKKHYFTVLLPPNFIEYVNNCKKYYIYAYAYNFEYGLYKNDNDLELMTEYIISFSNTYSFEGINIKKLNEKEDSSKKRSTMSITR